MKKISALFSVLFLYLMSISAQENNFEKKYKLTSSSTYIDFTSANLLDNYLSPLPYSGLGIKINSEANKLFSTDNLNLSSKSRFHINAGTVVNEPSTASMMYLGLNYGWGMFYHFYPFENFQILAGGIADVDFLFKTNLRNVNNPVNFDLALNVQLAAAVIYDIYTPKRRFRLQAEFESPLMGIMFAPQLGVSYYEMFSLGAKGKYVHLSSFPNKIGLKQRYFIEIPLKKSTWRIGLTGETLKYSANDIMFKKNNYGLFFGYARTLFSFNRKNPAPANFISY